MHASSTVPSATASEVSRPGAAGALARVGVALASFALVLVGLRAVAAPAGGSSIGGKLEYWQAHGHDYDTLFLGSSHVLRAFVPAEFDRSAAQFGVATRSFNFGLQAVHLLEQRYLLRAILDAQPDLRRVFFEYQWLTPQIDPQNSFDPRTVYWHDAESTRLACDRAFHWGAELGDGLHYVGDPARTHCGFDVAERLLPPALRISGEHVEHWATERLMLGRGKDVLKGVLGREHGQTERNRVDDGYISLEDDERVLAAEGQARNTYSVRRERFLAHQDEYRRDIDTLDAAEEAFGDADWVNADLTRVDDFDVIASIAREVRARGVEFVLVLLPSQSCNRPFEERLVHELGSPVLRYNVPERYPRLYEAASRFDSGHLSAEGAKYFSFVLARDYAAVRGSAEADPENPNARAAREGGSEVPQ